MNVAIRRRGGYQHGCQRSAGYCHQGDRPNDLIREAGYCHQGDQTMRESHRSTGYYHHGDQPNDCNQERLYNFYDGLWRDHTNKRIKLSKQDRYGDPSCDRKPDLPVHGTCQGLVISEDPCEGQPNGYNPCRGKKVGSNHTKDSGEPNPISLSEKKTKPLTDKQIK